MSDPGGSVDRGTVREQAARMIAETRCKAYAECMDHRYGPCPAHIEDAEDDAKALSHARLLRDDESLETQNILGMMWQREKRRAASAEAERDRLRAGIEKRCDEIKDRHQQNAHNSCDKCHAWEQYGAWPCGYIVEERAFRALLAESGTPAPQVEQPEPEMVEPLRCKSCGLPLDRGLDAMAWADSTGIYHVPCKPKPEGGA